MAFMNGDFEWQLEAAYVGGPVSIAGWQGMENAITGGPGIAFRQFFGRWILSENLGIELRYSWQRLERLDRLRVQEAGFSGTDQRNFGSAGPKAGLRLALSLGNHWTGSIGATAIGLFRRESSPGSTHTVFHPSVFGEVAVGYAF